VTPNDLNWSRFVCARRERTPNKQTKSKTPFLIKPMMGRERPENDTDGGNIAGTL
jgi:hypothetical protein